MQQEEFWEELAGFITGNASESFTTYSTTEISPELRDIEAIMGISRARINENFKKLNISEE